MAKGFQVGHRGVRVVLLQFSVRRGLTTTSLIELDDVEGGWVEVLPVRWLSPAARAAVNDHHRDAVRVSALLPGDGVQV